MMHWLANERTVQEASFVKRFDPRFWTIDFPRPMMASVVSTGPSSLRVEAVFYRKNDLAGLIWESADRWDHPLLGYETSRDYRNTRLSFRWRSSGVKPLDAIDGPTLTIEGRVGGVATTWYVRLWNYASGTPEDAAVTLDFDALNGGFVLPGEAVPVFAGDIDRMFISLVAPGYAAAGGMLANPAGGWVELSEIVCDGSGSVLALGDAIVPEHELCVASGYDDSYHLTPARLLRNALQLGYRDTLNHYVGMSHFFRLGADGKVTGALNAPCAAWHRDLAERCRALGFELILSLSYELFEAHCPEAWKQRAFNGEPALTGYTPPSALLSPANGAAMSWLQGIGRAFAKIAKEAGLAVRFQVGEPWWWVMGDGRICLYDDAAKAVLGGSPVEIANVRGALSAAQTALLDQAGALLANSTAALVAAVRQEAAGAQALVLVYLPGAFDPAAPELRRANMPPGWASPAFDVLQLEDYEWVTGGAEARTGPAVAHAAARLGYPIGEQHYLSGFAGAAADWPAIDAAADASVARGTAKTFVWALPQILRDGFVRIGTSAGSAGESEMQAFDDVDFPIAIGRQAMVSPSFSTSVVTMASGAEQRNAGWADARLRFDAGPGVRSEADIAALLGFFRARRGAARGFRFRDPFDHSSSASGAPSMIDQMLGAGDGTRTAFPLVKRYGSGADAQLRRITRPAAGSVTVAVGGAAVTAWTLSGGVVHFAAAPPAGAAVTAGFRFDVPVRFAEDRLDVSLTTFLAGEAASVPLIEVRE